MLTKDKDVQNYKYSGYAIGFDSTGTYNDSDGNAFTTIIFGADLGGSVHSNNKTEKPLILGRVLVQKLNGKTLYAEQEPPSNFTKIG